MSENTMNNLKIGVDVGGTKNRAVLVDAMGTGIGFRPYSRQAWQRCRDRRHRRCSTSGSGVSVLTR